MNFDIDDDESFTQFCLLMINKPGLKTEDRNEIKEFLAKQHK